MYITHSINQSIYTNFNTIRGVSFLARERVSFLSSCLHVLLKHIHVHNTYACSCDENSITTQRRYCAESCIDPSKFSEYHLFEKNLTKADTNDACANQYSANGEKYTKYVYTDTHSIPGLLKVEVDFYAQTNAPDHKCCYTDGSFALCIGKPEHLTIEGVKYCCPKGATVEEPCPK